MNQVSGQKPVEGALAFRKQSSLWDEGYHWVLTILVAVMLVKIFL